MKFDDALRSVGATLAPDVLLTPDGVKRDWAIQVERARITAVGPASELP